MVNALVLSWNEPDVVEETVYRLLGDPFVRLVIVTDNGSNLGSFPKLKSNPRLQIIRCEENQGPSVPRNLGLDYLENFYPDDHVFMIDSDILYVPGTVSLYSEVMDQIPGAGCVGYNDPDNLRKTGQNGKRDLRYVDEAPFKELSDSVPVYTNFPMAWTQYGLFNKEVVFDKGIRFPVHDLFGKPGHGYEDDWFYREMVEVGYQSYFLTVPMYYHKAHNGHRNLEMINQPSLTIQRRELYCARWGSDHWSGSNWGKMRLEEYPHVMVNI